MSDEASGALDGETPVNPYSLLAAVNDASETAHTAWLIFLALMTYLMVAVAGVGHRDLLLETPVALPILQVQIQQAQFFRFASVILVLVHLGVIAQLVLIARKTLEFDAAVRALELSDRRTHPLRLELHNFFFVQAVAGPHRSLVMSAFLHTMSWLTLVILPVLLLLFIQVTYLPFHDVEMTWIHRISLVADVVVLISIGVFLLRLEPSFVTAVWRTSIQHPVSFASTFAMMVATAFFSFFVVTIPGEGLDSVTRLFSGDPPSAIGRGDGQDAAGYRLPFLAARADGSFLGMFHRNLVVTDADLVPTRDFGVDETSVSLRGRDLRYARLDRSDLHRADLTGANLDGASLVLADLRQVKMGCADPVTLVMTQSRKAAVCASARRANLTRANLSGARMLGLDISEARLEEANLTGAEMRGALLTGAKADGAKADRADMQGVRAEGAMFALTSFQGTDLTGAQLQLADFTASPMQAATLAHASLEGAVMHTADLEAADLRWARLFGADLTNVRLRYADMRGAYVWLTSPPAREGLALADLNDLQIRPMNDSEIRNLADALDRLPAGPQRTQAKAALDPLRKASAGREWQGAPDQQAWAGLFAQSRPAGEAYALSLTDALASTMCKLRWPGGAYAVGVARRAQNQDFRGSVPAIYDRLRAADCTPGAGVPPLVLQNLATQADAARGN